MGPQYDEIGALGFSGLHDTAGRTNVFNQSSLQGNGVVTHLAKRFDLGMSLGRLLLCGGCVGLKAHRIDLAHTNIGIGIDNVNSRQPGTMHVGQTDCKFGGVFGCRLTIGCQKNMFEHVVASLC